MTIERYRKVQTHMARAIRLRSNQREREMAHTKTPVTDTFLVVFTNEELDELTKVQNFRPRKSPVVDKNMTVMLDGGWRDKFPIGITINPKGNVCCNGQHRLAAERAARRLRPALRVVWRVTYGPWKVDDPFDEDPGRTLDMHLRFRKVTNAPELSGLTKFALAFDRDGESISKALRIEKTYGNAAGCVFYDANAEVLRHCTKEQRRMRRFSIGAESGRMFWLILKQGEPRTSIDEFITTMGTASEATEGDPIWACRRWFERLKDGRLTASIEIKFAILTKAWNAWVLGKPLGMMRFGKKESIQLPVRTT